MREEFSRSSLLLGEKAVEMLGQKTVAVFGVGGVGGFAVEALARSGVGTLHLVDHDTVSLSNINRQIAALHSTVGKQKTEVLKQRVLDINPRAAVHVHDCFFLPENAGGFDFSSYDYVVDAVDTVTAKLELAVRAQEAGVPVISCMGAGNKLDPTAFEVSDIFQTSVCPLARVMRRELKKRGIERLKVVYSKEKPIKAEAAGHVAGDRAQTDRVPDGESGCVPGSVAFVPPVAGLILAGEVIRDLCNGITAGTDKKL